jgi:hypothetical protein
MGTAMPITGRLSDVARWTISVIVVLGLATWIVAASETFKTCMREAKNQASEQAPKKGARKVTFVIDSNATCAGKFLDKHNGAVTALFTIILAISTIALWSATKATALAAKNAAEHTRVVERAYVKMSHVSSKKNPDGSMIEGLILSGGKASVVIQVTNHGNTPADVADAFVQSWLGPLPTFPAYQRPESRTDRQGFLVRQDHFFFTEELEHAPAPRQDLFVFGYVTYRDRFGVTHYGGYARQYLRGTTGNNLGFVDNPNYNFDSERLPEPT